MSHNVLIRVDSSGLIGSGHAVRCLNLAERLRLRGCDVVFITRYNINNCNFLFWESNFELIVMEDTKLVEGYDAKVIDEPEKWLRVSQEQDAQETLKAIGAKFFDWLIVDHYALDYIWHDLLRPITKKLMVIDDLANRMYNCDLLLDQNFFLNKIDRYSTLVPSDCDTLFGPAHLLLSTHYDRYTYKVRKGSISKVLVFFGSIDNARQTELAVTAIIALNQADIVFDIIVGKGNIQASAIKRLCANVKNIRFHCQVDNMSEYIWNADFSLGAGGTTTWERAKLGLPSAVTIVADNQIEATSNAEKAGIVINLGHSSKVTSVTYLNVLRMMIESPTKLNKMSKNCLLMLEDSDARNVVDIIMG